MEGTKRGIGASGHRRNGCRRGEAALAVRGSLPVPKQLGRIPPASDCHQLPERGGGRLEVCLLPGERRLSGPNYIGSWGMGDYVLREQKGGLVGAMWWHCRIIGRRLCSRLPLASSIRNRSKGASRTSSVHLLALCIF